MQNLNFQRIADIFILLLLLIFIGQNLESVKVKFLMFGFELPLVILIAAVFFIGFYTAKVFNRKSK